MRCRAVKLRGHRDGPDGERGHDFQDGYKEQSCCGHHRPVAAPRLAVAP